MRCRAEDASIRPTWVPCGDARVRHHEAVWFWSFNCPAICCLVDHFREHSDSARVVQRGEKQSGSGRGNGRPPLAHRSFRRPTVRIFAAGSVRRPNAGRIRACIEHGGALPNSFAGPVVFSFHNAYGGGAWHPLRSASSRDVLALSPSRDRAILTLRSFCTGGPRS